MKAEVRRSSRRTRSAATASARSGHMIPLGVVASVQSDSEPRLAPAPNMPSGSGSAETSHIDPPPRSQTPASSPRSSCFSPNSLTQSHSSASSRTTHDSSHDHELDSSCFMQSESSVESESFNPWAWASNYQQPIDYYGTAYGLHNRSTQRPAFSARPYPALVHGYDSCVEKGQKRREGRYSPYHYMKQTVSRANLLQAWRTRVGLNAPAASSALAPVSYSNSEILSLASTAQSTSTSQPSRLPGSRGASLPLPVLCLIVRHMLDTAPPNIRPRKVLSSLALASKKMRSVAVPHIYEHVILRANGDAGIYARANCSKYVRQVTLQFDAHDPLSPRSVLSDSALYPQNAHNVHKYEESGMVYHFPGCRKICFVAKPAPERLQEVHGEGDSVPGGERFYSRLLQTPHTIATKLVQLVPRTIEDVMLDAELAEVSARFAVSLMTRSGDPTKEVLLEIHTRSDQVIQKVEHEVHSHIPRWFDPTTSSTRILLRGPGYGATIVWGESAQESRPVQHVWRTQKRAKVRARHPYHVKRQIQPIQEGIESPTANTDEPQHSALRRSARRTSSPYKRPLATSPTCSTPLRRSPRGHKQSQVDAPFPNQLSDLVIKNAPPARSRGRLPPLPASKSNTMSSTPVVVPEPSSLDSKSLQTSDTSYRPPPGQAPAWNAGRLAAEFPSVLDHTMDQIKQAGFGAHQRHDSEHVENGPSTTGPSSSIVVSDTNKTLTEEYAEFWSSVGSSSESWSPAGVWHPSARAEVETFLTAYNRRRSTTRSRVEKLGQMRELQGRETPNDSNMTVIRRPGEDRGNMF
ncbi:hypothetical protein BDV93DRAFT_511228 [Ceratobasidium sp. AG-I]|nr:hypothetical protein BDV93DRAFT_511228 [Ceratobasidium sp. AG-I]